MTAETTALARLTDEARAYAAQSKADSTLRAYRTDWRDFCAWCNSHNVQALPADPADLARYLAECAQRLRAATLQRRLASIGQAHVLSNYESPTRSAVVRTVMAGIRRVHGTAQTGKRPISVADLRLMVAALPDNTHGLRTAAIILLGFAAALRRSEIVALDVNHLEFGDAGLVINIARSKTDQKGAGVQIGVPYGSCVETCPVRTMKRWITTAEITAGPVFRVVNRHGQVGPTRMTARAVTMLVQSALSAAGKDAADYGAHSLRSGLCTAAAERGVSERSIANVSRHKSLVVLRRYIRAGSLFSDHPAAQVGL